jgi:MoxR-like ATPase
MSVTNKIIRSGKFCPIFIFGETGLGKSFSVNQLAARANREVIRINVNAQTCEEDFIGGFRLINGETVWQDGPLVIAMKRGAILLIDEVTALNPAYAFMLFTALEGEPVYIKKINKIVTPVDGFTVIATDNTKGYGTSSGKYVGVNVQNEAFLDRFTIAVEYDYPTPAQEFRMLSSFGNDEKIMKELIKWANFVRATYKEGAIDVTISPRRLINIMRINEIFGDLRTSIAHSIARFDADVVESLLDFLDKIVSDPNYSSNDEFNEVIENNDIEV